MMHLFPKRCFDDNNKAKTLTLGLTKMSCLVSLDLASYFKNFLISDLKNSDYVICFDEACNRII